MVNFHINMNECIFIIGIYIFIRIYIYNIYVFPNLVPEIILIASALYIYIYTYIYIYIKNNEVHAIASDALAPCHYTDAIMSAMSSQITSLTIVYSTVYSGADQRKHQSSVSLAFVQGIHRRPVNSPHKWPTTRKMFPFDDVIMVAMFFAAIILNM